MAEPDIVAFIEARLAEDEAVARGATAGPWLLDEGDEQPDHSLTVKGGPDQIPDVPGHETVVYSPHIWDETWPDFTHIGRHDPARVLREIEAKRALIQVAFAQAAAIDGEYGMGHTKEDIAADRCACSGVQETIVEILGPVAAIYADHPDYLPQWRLE